MKYAFAHLVLLHCKLANCNFRQTMQRCFLTIRILSKLPPKVQEMAFQSLNLKISSGLRPSFSTLQLKRASYGTACFCNIAVRKICVFLFVNCVIIFRIAKTFVASYAVKCSEYTPPPPPQLYMID